MHSDHVTLLTFASEKSASFSRSATESWCANIGHLSLDMHWRFVFILVGDVTHSRIWNDSLCASERAGERASATCDSSLLLKVASRARAGWCSRMDAVCGERCIPYARRVCIKSALSIALLPAASCNERIFPWLCADSRAYIQRPKRERERERCSFVNLVLQAARPMYLLDIN